MLDAAINRQVLRHFQVRKPESLKLDLNALFYPDFGLAGLPGGRSIALKLQELRAHAGHGPAKSDRLLSLILYGPPGTGKTTLVEAVAKTAGVPLVEITPSDILVGGAEGVERRTRHVFQALSKLTHVVILLDEFDSILLDRAKRNPNEIPTSVIEFLTPGMLPKLKALNDAGREQRISYVLATNFVDQLDAAVTRRGRFDEQLGVYPPDVVSRLGRLLNQLKVFQHKIAAARTRLESQQKALQKGTPGMAQSTEIRNQLKRLKKLTARIVTPEIIRPLVLRATKATWGAAMDQVGKPGWYTAPEVDGYQDKLFDYLLCAQKADKFLGNSEGVLEILVHREKKFKEEFGKETRRVADLAAQEAATRGTLGQVETNGTVDAPKEKASRNNYHEYWTTWEIVDKWEDSLKQVDEDDVSNWDKIYMLLTQQGAKQQPDHRRR
jgi:SpoVK/Ycf46/Vps4 family AAA+-type ATPase